MPRKIRVPADLVQNRQNQQRSRARRRERIEALERRLRDYERRDAQASAEMQRAARAVAWRNERLMLLLARHGVGRREVEEFLRAEADGGPGQCLEGASTRPELEDEPRVALMAPGVGIPAIPSSPRRGDRDATGQCGSPSHPPIRGEYEDVPVCDDGAGVSGTRDPTERAHLTPCDAAADIIANLQGHGDAAQARTVLGCGSVRDCHVKNTRLFQLMDEST
ncbi:hypothetical protein F5B20DRAFT_57640 [Whalleya microplaca]|nr:hypothetical protein F5B20DRAFT_57640 [Whalleya microplaca]